MRDDCTTVDVSRNRPLRPVWLTFAAFLAVSLLAFAAASPILFPRPCPVTKAAFDRIEEGMSLDEAQAVFGVPPGDYTTRPREPPDRQKPGPDGLRPVWSRSTEDATGHPLTCRITPQRSPRFSRCTRGSPLLPLGANSES